MEPKVTEEAVKKLNSLYESYQLIADDTYVFVCDMKYDYSRWSKALVESFGLPSEYMFDAGTLWEEHIHPEDRQAYRDGIDAIFSGKQQGHDMQYRGCVQTVSMTCVPAAELCCVPRTESPIILSDRSAITAKRAI